MFTVTVVGLGDGVVEGLTSDVGLGETGGVGVGDGVKSSSSLSPSFSSWCLPILLFAAIETDKLLCFMWAIQETKTP